MSLVASVLPPISNESSPEVPSWLVAARAADDKKAGNILVLDLRPLTSFTEYFVICEGTNPRQVQAIADEVHFQVKQNSGELPLSFEGFENAEWVLLDYGDFLVHVFSEAARSFYDLERLWRGAPSVPIPPAAPKS